MKNFIAVRECKVLASKLTKLQAAALERAEELDEEMAQHGHKPWPGIDDAPICFENAYQCGRAIEILEGIQMPAEQREVTDELAEFLQEKMDEAIGLLDESGMDTESVLFPKKRPYMRRPLQARMTTPTHSTV